MKIKLSQTTDLEKVPEKLLVLSIESLVQLEQIASQARVLSAVLATGRVDASTTIMEKLRLSMYELDTKLQDSQDIATSFINIMNEAAAQAEESPPEPKPDYSSESEEMEEFNFSTESQTPAAGDEVQDDS